MTGEPLSPTARAGGAADGRPDTAGGRTAGLGGGDLVGVGDRAGQPGRAAPRPVRARSSAHPAKMLPAVAAHAITHYTRAGELVLDPMCGIGTTLVEAVHRGRRAVGVEYETRWAQIARANLDLAGPGRAGAGQVITGDARHLNWLLSPQLLGQVALIVTSPPYGPSTHGQVDTGPGGIHKRDHLYGNLSTAGTWPTSATTGCWPGSPASSPSPPVTCAPAATW